MSITTAEDVLSAVRASSKVTDGPAWLAVQPNTNREQATINAVKLGRVFIDLRIDCIELR
jgi:hypothetical protein